MPVRPEDLDRAIARSRAALLRAQRPDGSWDERSDVGPASTANVLVALDHAGLLPATERAAGARWLRAQQREDGSFRAHPHAAAGDVSVTAQCYAALSRSPEPADRAAASRAWGFVAAHGGADELLVRMGAGDVAAVWLALAGELAPGRLPDPGLAWCLADPLVEAMSRRFHFGVVMGALQLSLIAKRLRGDFGADGRRRSWLDERACARALELLATFQNRDGSWNSNTVQTALAIPALLAAGLRTSDPRVQRAVRWLRSRRVETPDGIWFDVFSSDVWSTAFTVRALLLAGVAPTDPRMVRAIEWLLDAQLVEPMPRVNNRKPSAVRTGGWPFQTGNETMADCDDAGIVLSVLGMVVDDVEPALAARIRESIRRAREWLSDMQNPDGGWAAFVWNTPGERPSGYTLFSKVPSIPPDSLVASMRAFLSPPPELGDPSTEDLTARVLHGLGSVGADTRDPDVAAALRFLRTHQTEAGGFWGRWVCNYLASTSYVLGALARVREDVEEAYVRDAVAFVLDKQNPDGGFGESTQSYVDPERAFPAPSTVPLTALVVQGLVEVGDHGHPQVARAVEFLIANQRPDGSWPNDDYVATNIPPDGFYVYDGAAHHMPLEALARYARRHEQPPLEPAERFGRWSSAELQAWRARCDPTADAVAEALYASGDVAAINALCAAILKNDAPVPDGLPPAAQRFFEDTAALPAWADAAKIARAQELFAQDGVYVTFGLFCSSLPQAYCAGHGAQVLLETGQLLDRTRERIFETAQFLFDVLDVGGLATAGRGIRSAQRVRLMHAAVRRLIRHHGGWDAASLGEPINQEDLAGTLMTFGVVTYEAARRLGVKWSRADAEAWIHHWNVVGHLLGIEHDALPRDLDDAQDLMEAIRQHQWRRTRTGRALARALVDAMQELFTRDVPALNGLTPTLIRHLAGDHCADLLGVGAPDWTRLLVAALTVATRAIDVEDREGWLETQLGRVTSRAMRFITKVERRHKGAPFRLPDSLRSAIDAAG
ncbi:MAG: DUF2236 domain-containing protein [Sandaracinaceae bacterium]|nr:DUF2236 domain-containing protein [Sandaracinaceae bacterium]